MITAAVIAAFVAFLGAALDAPRLLWSSAGICLLFVFARFLP